MSYIVCWFTLTASTHDQEVFSFNAEDRFCHGFEEVLSRYRELVPQLRLAGIWTLVKFHLILYMYFIQLFAYAIYHPQFMAGPTSFAPVIEMAITIVEQSEGQYHVLLIIADGQVENYQS